MAPIFNIIDNSYSVGSVALIPMVTFPQRRTEIVEPPVRGDRD